MDFLFNVLVVGLVEKAIAPAIAIALVPVLSSDEALIRLLNDGKPYIEDYGHVMC